MKLFFLAMAVMRGFASPCRDDERAVPAVQQGRFELTASSAVHFIPPQTAHYFVVSRTPHVNIQLLQGPSCDFPLNLFRESSAWNPYFSGVDSVLLVQGELYTVQMDPGGRTTTEVHIGTNYARHVVSTDVRLQGLVGALCVFTALTAVALYSVWKEQGEFTLLEFWTLANYLLVYALASTAWALPWSFPLSVLVTGLSYRNLEGLSSSAGAEHAVLGCASVANVFVTANSLAVAVNHTLRAGEQCGTAACQTQMWILPAVGLTSLLVQLLLLPVHLERQFHDRRRPQPLAIALLESKTDLV